MSDVEITEREDPASSSYKNTSERNDRSPSSDEDETPNPDRDGPTPEELCAEICEDFENVEISADETEFLLQEALSLNKRLKAELQRQSHGGGAGIASSFEGSPLAAKPPRRGGKGSRTMLPPINHGKQGAPSKSKKMTPKARKLSSNDRVSLSAGVGFLVL